MEKTMYRKLLEKRGGGPHQNLQQNNQTSIESRSRQVDKSSISSFKRYEEGNEMLRSQFSELQMLTAENKQDILHFASGQTIQSDRKLSQRPLPGGNKASRSLLKGIGSDQSTSALTPMPDKNKVKAILSSSYNAAADVHIIPLNKSRQHHAQQLQKNSQKAHHSGSESILGRRYQQNSQLHQNRKNQNNSGLNATQMSSNNVAANVKQSQMIMSSTSRISMKQASAIEMASQKQSRSISKLQSRLRIQQQQQQQNINEGSNNKVASYRSSQSNGFDHQKTAHNPPIKTSSRFASVNQNAAVVAGSPAVSPSPAFINNDYIDANYSKKSRHDNKMFQKVSGNFGASGAHYYSNIVSGANSNGFSSTRKIPQNMQRNHQQPSATASVATLKKKSVQINTSCEDVDEEYNKGEAATSMPPLLNNNNDSSSRLRNSQSPEFLKNKHHNNRVDLEIKDGGNISRIIINKNGGIHHNKNASTNTRNQSTTVSPKINVKSKNNKNTSKQQQQTTAKSFLNNSANLLKVQTSSTSYQTQLQNKQRNEISQSVILNKEQREEVNDMIDKLDLQKTIRQKAKVFFDKSQNSILKQVNNKQRQGKSSQFSQQQLPLPETKIQKIVRQYNNNRADNQNQDEDNEILEKIYSERMTSNCRDIERDLNQILQNQKAQDNQGEPPTAADLQDMLQESIQVRNSSKERLHMQMEAELQQLHDDSMQFPPVTSIGHEDLVDDSMIIPLQLQEEMMLLDSVNVNANTQEDYLPSPQMAVGVRNSQEKEQSYKQDDYNLATGRTNETNHSKASSWHRSMLRKMTKPGAIVPARFLQGLNRLDSQTLLDIQDHYRQAQKQKHAQTMYITRQGSPKHKLTSFKKDYSPYILGQYRFGLNQHKPKSTDPEASDALRFSQMASYRFAESNAKFMELYNEQLKEYRKTRRFLAKEINKSPEMKQHANQIMSESPQLQKMQKKIKLQLIRETIREEIEAMQTSTESHHHHLNNKAGINDGKRQGLREIQLYNKEAKLAKEIEKELCSPRNQDNLSHRTVNSDSTSVRRMNHFKEKTYDQILFTDSVASPISNSVDEFYNSQISPKDGIEALNAKNAILSAGLDINQDFVSDASDKQKKQMKKATYEMDQLVTDSVFKKDELLMGLSLYYREHECEKRQDFQKQQKQLLNYLNILFGGNSQHREYIAMAKNLTKQLKRQDTTDSHGKQRAEEIFQEQTEDLGIDDQDINSEIIALLAGEILRKTQFFELYKGNTRGQQGIIQKSQMVRLQSKKAQQAKLPALTAMQAQQNRELSQVEPRQKSGETLFNEIVSARNSTQQAGDRNEHATKILDSLNKFNRLSSIYIDQRTHQDNYLKQIVKQTNQDAQFEQEMENIEDVKKQMAKASFITECEKNMVVTLPLLLRINNKKMILDRYQLNNGLCQALGIAFEQFREIANEIYLNSNNLSDEDFSVLLNGMCELQTVTALSYSYNTFGHKSLYALMPIVCNGSSAKNALREIHLKHCKMTAKVTNDLLFTLNQTKNYIRSLSLVNVNLNQSNYKELMQLIGNSRGQLQELDISWNGLRCHQMYEIIDVLSDNRTLQDLNLSFNNFHDQMQEKFAESTPNELLKNMALKQKLENQMKRAKTQAQKAAAEYDAMDNSLKHIMKLIRFIKMNSNLMHLNLSGMGMTQAMMHQFGRALRRTKSLVSLHLSQNNGDNEDLRGYMVSRAHIKMFEPIFRPDFKQLANLEYKADKNDRNNQKREFKLENSIVFGPQDQEDRRIAEGKSKISEQLNLKNMLKNKRGSINNIKPENDANEMLIFTRYLGHKTEMPGSGQWRMIATSNDIQERCWVCNLEIYTLVFWSRNFGLKHQNELYRHGIDEMAYENQLYEIEERNEQLGTKINFTENQGNPQLHEQGHKMIGFPYIYNEFNNWKPQRMYTIEEFCYIMDKNRPNILQNLQKGNFVREEVTCLEEMNQKEKKRYGESMKVLMNKYHKMKNWRKVLGLHCRYKKPFLANAEALIMGRDDVNIAKMDEQLAPSDSESDFGTASESNSSESEQQVEDEEKDENHQTEGNVEGNDGSETQIELLEEVDVEQDSIISVNLENQQNDPQSSIASPGIKSQQTLLKHGGASMSLIQQSQKKAQRILKEKTKMNKQLYVMPCFLKPGKQTFVIQSLNYETDIQQNQSTLQNVEQMTMMNQSQNYQEELPLKRSKPKTAVPGTGCLAASQNFQVEGYEMDMQYYFHEVHAPQRRERVPLFAKQLKRKENTEAAFDRNATVFKDWKPPTDRDLQRMFLHDKEFWKLPRFIKDEKHLNDVYGVFQKNIRKLFYVFITVSAGSNFPGVTWLDFTKFAEVCNVVSKAHGINQADVDRYFLASAGEMAGQGCYRFQFFEAIMRVADLKYLKSNNADSFAQALKMFLDTNCFALGPTEDWQEFRDRTWWCYETHKILHANQRHLNKIYKSHFAPRKKYMNKQDCVELMSKNSKIIPDENRVSYCYGMSKMHVILETTQKQIYDEMKYVEFLEFLGRCAHAKYQEEEDHISEKLKWILDDLFPTFGVTRIEVEEEEEEMSESDPDY